MVSATTAREKPILFSGSMVRAILSGTKRQTRRVVMADRHTHSPIHQGPADPASGSLVYHDGAAWDGDMLDQTLGLGWKGRPIATCPYGRPGDRLWVRETWRCNHLGGMRIEYRAGGACLEYEDWPRDAVPPYEMPTSVARVRRMERQLDGEQLPDPWRPSIHMPRWASRITLEITGVRVERLQEITEDDARAEGAVEAIMGLDGPAYDRAEKRWCRATKADDPDAGQATARGAFFVLWDSINGGSHPWSSNPWVWVLTFRRVAPDR